MARTKNVTNSGANAQADLATAIRENLSPEAVAAIIAYLQPVATKDAKVNAEVEWFGRQLAELLGDYEQVNRLMEYVGL